MDLNKIIQLFQGISAQVKRFLFSCFISALGIVLLSAQTAMDYHTEADRLYNKGGLENLEQSIELYLKALETNPDDYELNWKCARSYRYYGDTARKQNVEGWKKICAKHGKSGMNHALKAVKKEPDRQDGYYYYGLCVGIYSDGVSILTALKEGLKNKTQDSFEKAYEMDRMYDEAGSILSLGRFWAVLPWPLRDRKKSLKFYREYQATPYFADNIEAQTFLAELLLQLGGKENITEARGYLQNAKQCDESYFRNRAARLLAEN